MDDKKINIYWDSRKKSSNYKKNIVKLVNSLSRYYLGQSVKYYCRILRDIVDKRGIDIYHIYKKYKLADSNKEYQNQFHRIINDDISDKIIKIIHKNNKKIDKQSMNEILKQPLMVKCLEKLLYQSYTVINKEINPVKSLSKTMGIDKLTSDLVKTEIKKFVPKATNIIATFISEIHNKDINNVLIEIYKGGVKHINQDKKDLPKNDIIEDKYIMRLIKSVSEYHFSKERCLYYIDCVDNVFGNMTISSFLKKYCNYEFTYMELSNFKYDYDYIANSEFIKEFVLNEITSYEDYKKNNSQKK